MEIQITDNPSAAARRTERAHERPGNIQARTIANFLPLSCARAGANIVHNLDANYTGIRFDTKVGLVVLEMPSGRRPVPSRP
ncbi:hypothetical protein LV779_22080 [Streptomyces thinghirensis]|nr:hypothetical protein [Streptomyces thinghirensis]